MKYKIKSVTTSPADVERIRRALIDMVSNASDEQVKKLYSIARRTRK